jgi:hypothetical protein
MSDVEPRSVESVERLVPVQAGDRQVYIAVPGLAPQGDPGQETEIAARYPSLDQALEGVRAFAQMAIDRLRDVEASKVVVEFGCEFVLETGSFVAVIGKASAKSAMRVGLEWSKPTH